MDKNKRILIITVNAFSDTNNNGKTLANIFKDYPKCNIAQLYLYPEFPDNAQYSNIKYYRITDSDVIRSILNRGKKCGSIVSIKVNVKSQNKKIYKLKLKNLSSLRLGRDILWYSKYWLTSDLKSWIKEFHPDELFLNGLNNFGVIDLANTISNEFGLTKKVFATDDYFMKHFSLSPAYHLRRLLLIKNMKKLLKDDCEFFTINKYMQKAYLELFKKNSEIIVNYPNVPEEFKKKLDLSNGNDVLNIVYIGNLSWNRYKTIGFLSEAIYKKYTGVKYKISVYSKSVTPMQLKVLEKYDNCKYCGNLMAKEVDKKMEEADILLIAESFDYFSRKAIVLSLSTKTTEYLAACRPILAIGPKEIGTMRFLMDNTKSICICKKSREVVCKELHKLESSVERENIAYSGYHYMKKLEKEKI
ncbi:MAG: hypothetical protein RSC93_08425 [Erysipelotrichaceae bacterium]